MVWLIWLTMTWSVLCSAAKHRKVHYSFALTVMTSLLASALYMLLRLTDNVYTAK